jgi:hypothetical protein
MLPAEAPADDLGNRRHVAFVLRLVVELDGSIAYGELLSLDSVPKGHFTTWDGLRRVLEASLAAPRG